MFYYFLQNEPEEAQVLPLQLQVRVYFSPILQQMSCVQKLKQYKRLVLERQGKSNEKVIYQGILFQY